MPDRAVEENAQARRARRSRACAPARSRRPRATTRRGASRAAKPSASCRTRCVAWGDPTETLRAILAALAGGDGEGEEPELISVLAGEDAPLGLGEIEQMTDGAVELELRQGGQPAYWWLLAAE